MKKLSLFCVILMIVLTTAACSSGSQTEVKPTAQPAAAPTAATGDQETSQKEEAVQSDAAAEQLEYEVVLVDSGETKLEVIKVVRNGSGLDLAGSKAIVDGAPATVTKGLGKDEADKLKAELEAAGATVELVGTEKDSQQQAEAGQQYEVVLVDPGAAKLNVVKTIKDSTGLDLAGSKAIVDGAPATVAKGLSKEDADKLKAALEDVGATIELK